MEVYSQLAVASQENLSSDPSLLPEGRFWFNTTSFDLKVRVNSITTILLRNDKAVFGTSGTAASNVKFQRSAAGKFQFLLGNDATAEGSVSANLAELDAKIANYANTGALPTAGVPGRLSFVTGTTLLYWDTGAAWVFAGDTSSNTATSVDSEVALFSGTGGKTIKRATGTGVAHLTSGVLSASNVVLTSEVTGTLPIANGGTNSTASATAGGIGYGTGTAHAYTSAFTSGRAILSGGAGAPTEFAPTAGNVLIAGASGILSSETSLSLARGGTNRAITAVNGGIAYGSATDINLTAAGSAGQILQSAGAATPVWLTTAASQWAVTAVNVSNLNTQSGGAGQYHQFGAIVIFSFVITLSVTSANTTTTARINLPVPSAFTLTSDASGSGGNGDGSVNGCAGTIAARTATADMMITFRPDTTGAQTYSFSGLYVIK